MPLRQPLMYAHLPRLLFVRALDRIPWREQYFISANCGLVRLQSLFQSVFRLLLVVAPLGLWWFHARPCSELKPLFSWLYHPLAKFYLDDPENLAADYAVALAEFERLQGGEKCTCTVATDPAAGNCT